MSSSLVIMTLTGLPTSTEHGMNDLVIGQFGVSFRNFLTIKKVEINVQENKI